MGRVTRAAAIAVSVVLAAAGCKNQVLDVIAHQYDEAGGFDPRFIASASSFLVSNSVTFTNETLAEVRTIHWDFGDGTSEDNVSAPVHTYAAKGIYTVTMTATSMHGTTRSYQLKVFALGTEPTVVVSSPSPSSWVGLNHVAIAAIVVDQFGTNPGVQSVQVLVNSSPVAASFHGLSSGEIAASQASGYTYTYDLDSTSLTGSNTITVEAIDKDSLPATTVVSVNVDNIPPPTPTLAFSPVGPYTGSASVSLTISGTDADSGVAQMQFSNDGTAWSVLEPFAAAKSWTLAPGGDGARTVYVRVTDRAGNVSPGGSSVISLDTLPPQVASAFTINAGAAATNSTSGTLTFAMTDPGSGLKEMRFSNDNSTWSAWEPYATGKAWTLPGSDGTKTVFAQFDDNYGRVTTATISDTIVLDTAAPTITSVSFTPAAGWLKSGSTARLNITTASSETGLTAGAISINGVAVGSTLGGSGTSWHVDYTVGGADANVALDSIPISIVLVDQAVNSCSAYTTAPATTPGVDTVPPSINAITFNAHTLMIVQFSEAVYRNTSGGPLQSSSVAGIIDLDQPTVTGVISGSPVTSDGIAYSYSLTWSGGDPATNDNIQVTTGTIYDQAGNSSTSISGSGLAK